MKKAKLAAQVLIYDDMQYVGLMLEEVTKYCDEVLFLVNKHPLNVKPGVVYDNSHIVKQLEELRKDDPKIKIAWEDWKTEEETRNAGLDWAASLNCEYSLIVDTDEIYDGSSLHRLTGLLEDNENTNAGHWILHTGWKTYWKKDGQPLCVITPSESFQPVVLVRNQNARFTHLRHCSPFAHGQPIADQNKGRGVLPEGFLNLHHLSYARSDEFIKRKCEESGHSANGDLMIGWYENVWLKWKLGDKNIHPINPSQYAEAIPVDVAKLPVNNLRTYFGMELKW